MFIEKSQLFSEVFNGYELHVSQNGYVITGESWKQGELKSPFSRIYYVMDGEAVFIRGGEEIKIEPGYAYFAPCGISYGFRGTPGVEKMFFHVNIDTPSGYDLFDSDELYIARVEKSRRELDKMLKCYRSDDPIDQIALKSEIWETVAHFAMLYNTSGEKNVAYSETVRKAIAHIHENLSATLKVDMVASAVFRSPSTLTDLFKREIGKSVAKYIDDMLMLEASRRLALGNETVGEISASLGYCDQFYFSRRFVKYYSITPRDYKKLRGES